MATEDMKPEDRTLARKVNEIDRKLTTILELLTGREIDEQDEGLIGDFRKIKQTVYKLVTWKEKTVSWAMGLSFGGGAAVAVIIALIVNAIKNSKQ